MKSGELLADGLRTGFGQSLQAPFQTGTFSDRHLKIELSHGRINDLRELEVRGSCATLLSAFCRLNTLKPLSRGIYININNYIEV